MLDSLKTKTTYCFILLWFFTQNALANKNTFINKVPAEIGQVDSQGLLSTIFSVAVLVLTVVVAVLLVAIPIVTINNAMTVLRGIGEGRKTYGDLAGNVIAGVVVELIAIAFVYYAWDYIGAATKVLGAGG